MYADRMMTWMSGIVDTFDDMDDRYCWHICWQNEDMDLDREEPEDADMQVVLHEDKKYYPTPEEVFGPDVEVHNLFCDGLHCLL